MTFSRQSIHNNLFYWIDFLIDKHPEFPVFYDVGAHEGEFFDRYKDKSSLFVAIEPNEVLFRELVKHPQCRAYCCALWDHSGRGILHHYSDSSFNSLFVRSYSDTEHYGIAPIKTSSVELRKLDELVESEKLPPPNIMKIDAEGSELFILRGGEKVINNHRPIIISEQSVENTANAHYTPQAIREYLSEHHYVLRGLSRSQDLRLYSSLDDKKFWNILALPDEKDWLSVMDKHQHELLDYGDHERTRGR